MNLTGERASWVRTACGRARAEKVASCRAEGPGDQHGQHDVAEQEAGGADPAREIRPADHVRPAPKVGPPGGRALAERLVRAAGGYLMASLGGHACELLLLAEW
jgi:hypothetical protein